MARDESEPRTSNSKFQPFQVVRIKETVELKGPGSLAPMENSRGKTGVVETEGRVCASDREIGSPLERAYFVRVEGIGPVLVCEEWLEDAETAG